MTLVQVNPCMFIFIFFNVCIFAVNAIESLFIICVMRTNQFFSNWNHSYKPLQYLLQTSFFKLYLWDLNQFQLIIIYFVENMQFAIFIWLFSELSVAFRQGMFQYWIYWFTMTTLAFYRYKSQQVDKVYFTGGCTRNASKALINQGKTRRVKLQILRLIINIDILHH